MIKSIQLNCATRLNKLFRIFRHRPLGLLIFSIFFVSSLAIVITETAEAANAPNFVVLTGADNPFNGIDVGIDSKPALVDLNNDGDLDLVIGEREGTLLYYENTGNALTSNFLQRTGTANPFFGFDVGFRSSPTFADVDSDGDLDAVVGENGATLRYFENIGDVANPLFVTRSSLANPFFDATFPFSHQSSPALVDIDGNGLSTVVGYFDNLISYDNTGTATMPVFELILGTFSIYNNLSGSKYAPAFADMDLDGDLDLVNGGGGGSFANPNAGSMDYFENTGTASAPIFGGVVNPFRPFLGIDVGQRSGPALGDLDADGDIDIVVGREDGTLLYMENLITTRAANPNDFNGDKQSDIPLYRADTGALRIWEMNGGAILSNTFAGALGTNFEIAGFADTNADGNDDVIWLDPTTGAVRIWLMDGGAVIGQNFVSTLSAPWVLSEIGDFNNDNQADLLWHRPDTGAVRLWTINNGLLQSNDFVSLQPPAWEIRGLADMNNDGMQDIVWRNNTTSDIRVWLMSGASLTTNGYVGGFADTNWTTAGLGDFNNDSNDDILMRNTITGAVRIWEMNGVARIADVFVSVFPTVWNVQNVGDYNNDGTDDILWQQSIDGGMRLWPMANSNLTANTFIGTYNDTDWKLSGHGDYNGDGNTDVLWQNQTTGSVRMWLMNSDVISSSLFVGLITPFIVVP